jgi:hypothetical protein
MLFAENGALVEVEVAERMLLREMLAMGKFDICVIHICNITYI